MKFLTSLTLATTVFAAEMNAQLDTSKTQDWDYQGIAAFADKDQNGIVTREEIKKFLGPDPYELEQTPLNRART